MYMYLLLTSGNILVLHSGEPFICTCMHTYIHAGDLFYLIFYIFIWWGDGLSARGDIPLPPLSLCETETLPIVV